MQGNLSCVFPGERNHCYTSQETNKPSSQERYSLSYKPSFYKIVLEKIVKTKVNNTCYGLNAVASTNSYIEVLLLKLMVLRGGDLGMWLYHECGVLMNGISVLIKEAQESSIVPSTIWGYSEKTAYKEARSHQTSKLMTPQNLGLSSLQKCEK